MYLGVKQVGDQFLRRIQGDKDVRLCNATTGPRFLFVPARQRDEPILCRCQRHIQIDAINDSNRQYQLATLPWLNSPSIDLIVSHDRDNLARPSIHDIRQLLLIVLQPNLQCGRVHAIVVEIVIIVTGDGIPTFEGKH